MTKIFDDFQWKLGFLGGLLLLVGCSYKFSNAYYRAPSGVKTLYIESIFNTSKLVLPHQILWEEIQETFARDGRVLLTNSKKADAYLRIQIKEASEVQYDKDEWDNPVKADLNGNLPPTPKEVPDLKRAGKYAKKARMGLLIIVESYHLRTKKVLLKKQYTSNVSFNQIYGEGSGQNASNNSLRAKEARDKGFHTMSVQLAENIKRDFLRRRSL